MMLLNLDKTSVPVNRLDLTQIESKVKNLEESSGASQCPICFRIWQETILAYPRVLDCGHSLCLDCISKCI